MAALSVSTGATIERRRYGRHRVERVGGTIADSEVKVRNISLEGLSLELSQWLKVGRTYRLNLMHEERLLRIKAAVAWSNLVGTERNKAGEIEPVYRAGIHVDKIMSGRASFYEFIQDRVVIALEPGLMGRVTVQVLEGSQAGLTADCSVRRMSLSGLLLATETGLEVGSHIQMQLVVGERTLAPEGRVVRVEWLERKDSHPVALVAVEFVELADELREGLVELIRWRLMEPRERRA